MKNAYRRARGNRPKKKKYVAKKVKTKAKTQQAGNALAGLNLSLTTVSKGKKNSKISKYYKMITNPAKYMKDGVTGLVSATGLQYPVSIDIVPTTLLTSASNATAQFYNNTVPAFVSVGLSGANPGAQNFLYQKAYTRLSFINQTPANVKMTIYALVSRVTKLLTTRPEADWATGLVNEKGIGPQALNTNLNQKPTASKVFNMNWKIKGTAIYEMQPGETGTFVWNDKKNHLVDVEYLNTYGCVKGLTTAILFVTHGSIGDNTKTKAVTPAQIGLSASKIDVTWTTEVQTRLASPFPRLVTYEATNIQANSIVYVQDTLSGVITDANTDANYA